jgi:peptidyl-prolyl cis-trans isomerase SurA
LGGNLGFTDRGTLVHDYEEVAYALLPGELSLPVRSRFGYHLIRLVDKRGEKISSQHILINIPFSDLDKAVSFDKINNIYKQTNNDPFVFDSLSIVFDNKYNNSSGVFVSVSPYEIPPLFLNHLNNSSPYVLSQPIKSEFGYSLLYLYEHNNSYLPSPENSWELIYQLAKQYKQNNFFSNYINTIKQRTYIKRNFY